MLSVCETMTSVRIPFSLDTASFENGRSTANTPLRWPTPQRQYEILSYELPRQLTEYALDATSEGSQDHTALIACLFDAYLSLVRIGRATIDIENIRRAGVKANFDPAGNPLLAFLAADNQLSTSDANGVLPHWDPGLRRSPSLRDRLRDARQIFRMALPPHRGRCDVLARGGLVEDFISGSRRPWVNFNPYIVNWPEPGEIPQRQRHMAHDMTRLFLGMMTAHYDLPSTLIGRMEVAANLLVQAWVNRAWHYAQYLKTTLVPHPMGDIAVGSSPKLLGRLLGSLYRSQGKMVVRCAHGGERPFFDDDHWGLSELPFCDRYLGHSHGEAEALARRHRENRMIRVHATPPVCLGLGSQRHQRIFTAGLEKPTAVRQARSVMIVASSFLGEGNSHVPAIKPADVLIADLEIHLMATLRAAGFHVSFKPHPKTVKSFGTLYDGSFDTLVTRPFDPVGDSTDVYVFDYAGSAFFDALAARRGIVLIDTGLRPFDRTTLDDLKSRIEIVEAREDELLRLRTDPSALVAAIERAAQNAECPDWFADRYFRGAPPHEWLG